MNQISHPERCEGSLVDYFGREFRVTKPFNRIVSLVPSTTETLFAIGAGKQVIAITSFGNTLKDALEKSYKNSGIINYEEKYYRKDIGKDLM